MSALALTPDERDDLDCLELHVKQSLEAFVAVGNALAEIRDRRLYREGYDTFETYLADRWGLKHQRAYQLIAGAAVSTIVDKAGLPAPVNEAQARELVPLLNDDPEGLEEAWAEVIDRHGPKPTAAQVRDHVRGDHDPEKPLSAEPGASAERRRRTTAEMCLETLGNVVASVYRWKTTLDPHWTEVTLDPALTVASDDQLERWTKELAEARASVGRVQRMIEAETARRAEP